MVVKVEMLVEPPLKWPLWFDNEIRDSEELTPITGELKQELVNLCVFFENHTIWNDERICFFWINKESKVAFQHLTLVVLEHLSQELGDGYEIRNKMFDLPALPPR